MSFSQPSQVSATTGSDHQAPVASSGPCATRQAITASRTTPTLWVLVIITGPSRKPDSSTQVVPVISPLPFSANQPANAKRSMEFFPRGRIAVTPVRTGPLPTMSLPWPLMSVVCPTSHAADVGDGVERARRAVERNAKVARARFRGLIRRLGGREADAEQQPGHGEGEFVDHEGRGIGGSGGVMPALTLPAPGQVMQPPPRGAPETAGGPATAAWLSGL